MNPSTESLTNALSLFTLENPMLKPAAEPRVMVPPPAPNAAPAKQGLVTAKAMKDCAHFTKGAASLFHPDYSFTIQGVKMLFDPHPDQFGITRLFGALVLMAAPVEEVLRLGVGVGGTVGGAAATAVTATAVGAEWAGRGASNAIHSSHASPAQQHLEGQRPSAIRESLVRSFVERMMIAVKSPDISFKQQNRFKEHPGELIGLLALTVALQSRHIPGRQLKTGKGDIITKETVAGLDSTSKDYFDGLCEMKFGIEYLELGHDDIQAWQQLVQKLIGSSENSAQQDVYEIHKAEKLQTIIAIADSLSNQFVLDEGFQAHWKKSTSQL